MTNLQGSRVRVWRGGACRTAVAVCCAFVALSAPVAHAAGPYVAERLEVVVDNGSGESEDDLITGTLTWQYDVGAETCPGEWSDYYMLFRGPYRNEDGSKHEVLKASVGVLVRRAMVGGTRYNHVIRYCERCSAQYEDMGVYSPVDWATVNERWAWYLGSRQGWVTTIDWTSTHLKEANLLRVGGEVQEHSELGPFLHQLVKYRRASTSGWSVFTPSNTTGQLLHSAPPRDRDLFSWYESAGSVGVYTLGTITCP